MAYTVEDLEAELTEFKEALDIDDFRSARRALTKAAGTLIAIPNYEIGNRKVEYQNRIIDAHRLLVKLEGEWEAFAYVWNDEQTEAEYKITGASIPMEITHAEEQISFVWIFFLHKQLVLSYNLKLNLL